MIVTIEGTFEMNRKNKKLIYISIKDSWRKYLTHSKIIDITTTMHHGLLHNTKHPLNRIIMDFKNRDEIVKYGFLFNKELLNES